MKALLVGYKASDLDCFRFDGELTVHELDIYHAHAVAAVHPGLNVVCSAHLPRTASDGSKWDRIFFRTGPKLMSGELSLDLLQEAYGILAADAPAARVWKERLVVDYIGRERDRNDLVEKVRDDPMRVRSFRAEWSASVPDGNRLTFVSSPGCFCHRRLDEGGLALAEVVTRDLERLPDPMRLIDMGCGCGLVGLLVADFVRSRRSSPPGLLLVDSHSRAVEAARENAAKFGIAADVAMCDNGIDGHEELAGAFDVFVGNPPYYSDYRIADVFLKTAVKALKRGGVCYSVCKNAAGLEPVQKRYFDTVEIVNRRGYAVLRSVKG